MVDRKDGVGSAVAATQSARNIRQICDVELSKETVHKHHETTTKCNKLRTGQVNEAKLLDDLLALSALASARSAQHEDDLGLALGRGRSVRGLGWRGLLGCHCVRLLASQLEEAPA